MIESRKQYEITLDWLQKFKKLLSELNKIDKPIDINDQLKHQLCIDELTSQIESLEFEILLYDANQL